MSAVSQNTGLINLLKQKPNPLAMTTSSGELLKIHEIIETTKQLADYILKEKSTDIYHDDDAFCKLKKWLTSTPDLIIAMLNARYNTTNQLITEEEINSLMKYANTESKNDLENLKTELKAVEPQNDTKLKNLRNQFFALGKTILDNERIIFLYNSYEFLNQQNENLHKDISEGPRKKIKESFGGLIWSVYDLIVNYSYMKTNDSNLLAVLFDIQKQYVAAITLSGDQQRAAYETLVEVINKNDKLFEEHPNKDIGVKWKKLKDALTVLACAFLGAGFAVFYNNKQQYGTFFLSNATGATKHAAALKSEIKEQKENLPVNQPGK